MIIRCPKDCSGNGTCTFVDLNTGQSIRSCNVLSDTCSSNCLCINGIITIIIFIITFTMLIGMSGSACDTSIAQLKEVQSKQEDLLEQLLR